MVSRLTVTPHGCPVCDDACRRTACCCCCCASRARALPTDGRNRGSVVRADTPLTDQQLDEAEAAWDRVKSGETDKSRDHAYLDTITHPFFEDVAKQVLRAPAVQLLETNPHDRPPGSGATSWSGGHLDVQITRSGWDATPRREMLAVWLWCNGVPPNRGAMR